MRNPRDAGVEEIGDESSKFEIRTAVALWGEHGWPRILAEIPQKESLMFFDEVRGACAQRDYAGES